MSLFSRYTASNPSELCARGAAYIASHRAEVTEVLSRSLGIGVEDGEFEILVSRASPLPIWEDRTLILRMSGTTVIDLYEGEDEVADANVWSGSFRTEGYPPGCEDEFEIHIQVNADREVTLSAEYATRTEGELHVNREEQFTEVGIAEMKEVCNWRLPGHSLVSRSTAGLQHT